MSQRDKSQSRPTFGTMVVPPRDVKGTGVGLRERLTLSILGTLGLSI